MLTLKQGDLLAADVDALVNAVNCAGVMGKGLALQFKQRFPDNFARYAVACKAGEVRLGAMFIVDQGEEAHPRYIINFPTKQHWRGKSRLADIETGLPALVADAQQLGIHTLALPALGCGNGGLAWDDVRPLIEAAFGSLEDITAWVYAPQE